MRYIHTWYKKKIFSQERLQAALLGPRFGEINDARRDKFLMNEAMRDAGLAAARQIKTGDRSKVQQFLAALITPQSNPPPSGRSNIVRGEETTDSGDEDDGCQDDAEEEEEEKDQVFGENAKNVRSGAHGLGASTAPRKAVEGGGEGDTIPCLDGVLSVVKPARGCASGSVFLCKGEDEAMEAFGKILGTPKYGTPGEFNDEVTKKS